MKKIFLLGILFVLQNTFAQEVKPKFEVENEMVKATYYYDNGQIREQGYYLDGKLHGEWISYTIDGSKQTIGEYNKGMKVGKWFFWKGKTLSEVDYNGSKIANVKKWSREVLVQN